MLRSFRIVKVLWLALIFAFPATGQPARPAVEYRSLLNVAFAESYGELLINNLHILFPPPGYDQAELTVSTVGGEEVARVHLRLDSYLSFPVFGRFVPEINPTQIKLTKPGDYVLTVKIANDAITRFPLTIGAEFADNPYDPPKRFWREGPWRDFAYLSLPTSNSGGNLRFNWWMSLRELPIGMTDPSITLHLLDNFREVGASRESFTLNEMDWQFFSSELEIKSKKSVTVPLAMRHLVERDRIYLLVVKANGTPIKSFRLETKGGRLMRVEQCRIDFEPHEEFIAPRFIESLGESDSAFLVTDAYWVRRSGERRSFPSSTTREALNPQINKQDGSIAHAPK